LGIGRSEAPGWAKQGIGQTEHWARRKIKSIASAIKNTLTTEKVGILSETGKMPVPQKIISNPVASELLIFIFSHSVISVPSVVK
jgi:hypothetical protein